MILRQKKFHTKYFKEVIYPKSDGNKNKTNSKRWFPLARRGIELGKSLTVRCSVQCFFFFDAQIVPVALFFFPESLKITHNLWNLINILTTYQDLCARFLPPDGRHGKVAAINIARLAVKSKSHNFSLAN